MSWGWLCCWCCCWWVLRVKSCEYAPLLWKCWEYLSLLCKFGENRREYWLLLSKSVQNWLKRVIIVLICGFGTWLACYIVCECEFSVWVGGQSVACGRDAVVGTLLPRSWGAIVGRVSAGVSWPGGGVRACPSCVGAGPCPPYPPNPTQNLRPLYNVLKTPLRGVF